jgi:cytochrome c-type protein NapB
LPKKRQINLNKGEKMRRVMKVAVVGSLIASTALYAASTAGCVGCHGTNFEKHAMGKSKVVKDMSKADIVAALKGYKDGSYGGAMKGIMKGQVTSLSDADMQAIADSIKGGSAAAPAPAAAPAKKVININEGVDDQKLLDKQDLGKKKVMDETVLGLRKQTLFEEDVTPVSGKFDRPAAGTSNRFERAYVNAPPMIPHSVEGLLPITQDNNQCLGCHMPDVAKGVGATSIPPSHFTNYRPTTKMEGNKVVKEGKELGQNNTSDVLIAKAKKLNHLYQGRFNCSQCHAPQADVKPIVGNTFKSDGLTGDLKSGSNLIDVINEGVE